MPETLRLEGIKGLFRGWSISAICTPLFHTIYFPLYEGCKVYFKGNLGWHDNDFKLYSLSASISGIACNIITNPFWVVRTRMQAELDHLQKLLLPRDPNDDRDVLLEIRAGTGGDESALFAGDLKLVRNQPPVGTGDWQLFDIARDPGEPRDLRASRPAEFARLLAAYKEYENADGVRPLPAGYEPRDQVAMNALRRVILPSLWWPALLTIALVVGLWALLRRRNKT